MRSQNNNNYFLHKQTRDCLGSAQFLDRQQDQPLGGRGVPPVGIGIGGGWGESERRPQGWTIIANEGKIEEGIEGGEDGGTHARDFEQALYVAQIAPPMLPAVVVICFPPWTRVTIREWRLFGREEEDEDDDGN